MAEIVKLNVGGVIYTTSRSTLTKYPNSMLGTMFSGRLPTTKDEHGNYWIDANGQTFGYVLEFLRRGCLMVPDHFQDFEILEKEADFYQINELTQSVKSKRYRNQPGIPDDSENVQYLAVQVKLIKDKPYHSRVQICGPSDAISQLSLRFSAPEYKAMQGMNNINSGQQKLTIASYSECHLPLIALKVEILNIGFSVSNMHDDMKNPDATHVFWFVRKRKTTTEPQCAI
ncbi:BTB/POZ domain-containing protein KCTD6-like [Amphiura filiformis]|uniref:BTB/POZ domain-containing protein KCTD6-like n=1 Tax=Amphiura filiformis TaxID=82378 RepID=UPI003B227ECB